MKCLLTGFSLLTSISAFALEMPPVTAGLEIARVGEVECDGTVIGDLVMLETILEVKEDGSYSGNLAHTFRGKLFANRTQKSDFYVYPEFRKSFEQDPLEKACSDTEMPGEIVQIKVAQKVIKACKLNYIEENNDKAVTSYYFIEGSPIAVLITTNKSNYHSCSKFSARAEIVLD